jgi:plastocyanin
VTRVPHVLALGVGAAVLLAGPARGADATAPSAPAPPAGMAAIHGTVRLTSASVLGDSEVKARDAVVYLEGQVEARWKERRGELPRMIQRDKAFSPGLLVVRVGQTVVFPNEDVVFHNVFSLTEGNQFDLGVYAQGKSKAVRFQKPGVVDVFCNIHPQMIASIVVVENPFHAQLGEEGRFRLEVPPGKHKVVAYWARGVREEREVELAAGQVLDLDFALRDTGQKIRHLDKNGQAYGRYK